MHKSRNILLTLCVCLSLLACSKLSNENYAKIKIGMPFSEVTALLGTPTRCDDMMGVKSCRWGDDKRNITINFVADQVVLHTAENIR